MEEKAKEAASHAAIPVSISAMLVTLGVVYGDIGTSPMYVTKALVAGNERLGYIHRTGADIAVHHAQRDEHRRDAHRNRSVRGCLLGLFFHKPVSSQL